MATISEQTLKIEKLNPTTVKVIVKYKLTPSSIERLAGTVFTERIQLIGDDFPPDLDTVRVNFPADAFAVNTSTPSVVRTRTRNVLKSALNEDVGEDPTGAIAADEIFARITLGYAANAPIPPTAPFPASTNTVTGAWG